MLVILKCKHCGTTFPIQIDTFYNASIKCSKCYTTLDNHYKQRLFDITDNLESLNNFMDKFSIIGLTDAQPQSHIFENLAHLESLYMNADKNSKALIENIIDDIYLLSRSPLGRSDLKELTAIYQHIHKLYINKCNFENNSLIEKTLNSSID
nr:hypothetical protein [uncultured Cellulosilyticum sp.]